MLERITDHGGATATRHLSLHWPVEYGGSQAAGRVDGGHHHGRTDEWRGERNRSCGKNN